MSHKSDLKKVRQRLHAKNRALSRYGLELKTRDLKEIGTLIKKKDPKYVTKLYTPNFRISLWKVVYNDIILPVAWDCTSKTVATVLPPRALERYPVEKQLNFKCPHCPAKFKNQKQLDRHILKRHESSDQQDLT